MKKLGKLLLVLVLIASSIILINTTKIKANEIDDINTLISKLEIITNDSSSDAYIIVTDISNYIENYSSYNSIYNYITYYCREAKNYSLSMSNAKNKILGGLYYLRSKLNNEPLKSPLELIGDSLNFTTDNCPEAYKWAFEISELNELNNTSSVYSDILYYVNEVKNYSLSMSNAKNKLVADLTVLDGEIASSSILTDLNITKIPNKIVYTEGDTFNPNGVEITAIFNNTYKDGTTTIITKTITDYLVDTTTKLSTSDKYVTFSYNYNGSTYTVNQNISVEKYVPELVSKVLTSIEVTSQPNKTEYLIGEYFDSTGLKVSAKYKNIYSDNSTKYTTENNIKYTVDENTTLTKSDKSWTISYYDDGITVETDVKIKVKSADPVLNSANIELTPGDVFKLNVLGTDKYVMYKCENNNIIELTTDGGILALHPGTIKITATIGSGKKNTKLICTVTVKSKITTDKKVIFINSDEYETLKVKNNKYTYSIYSNSSNINLIKDEKNENLYQIIPSKTSYNYNSVSIINIYYTDTRNYSYYRDKGINISNNYSSFIEQKIPVFMYCDNSKKLKFSIYEHKENNKFNYAQISFNNGNTCIEFYNEKLYKQFKKSLKEIKDNNYNSSYKYYEITKTKFEKLIKKYIKSKNYTISDYSGNYIVIK